MCRHFDWFSLDLNLVLEEEKPLFILDYRTLVKASVCNYLRNETLGCINKVSKD